MDDSNIFKCFVCQLQFKEPRLLPCQHNVCTKPCLEDLIKNSENGLFSCPECRTKHGLPEGGVQSFARNDILDTIAKHSDTLLSTRKATASVFLASDEVTYCKACNKECDSSHNCLHCGEKICKSCYDQHVGRMKEAILDFKEQIEKVIDRLKEKEDLYVKAQNGTLACHGDLKRLFQLFEQRLNDMEPFLSSVELLIDETDAQKLIAAMFQGEEHLLALYQIELDPKILGLSRSNMTPHTNNIPQGDSRDIPMSLHVGLKVRFIVSLVAMVITCVRFATGAFVAMQGIDIVKTAGSLLMAKSVVDLGIVLWASMERIRTDLKSNFKAAFGSFLVLLNCLFSIIVAIFAYAPLGVMDMYELALRVAVGIDCVWSFLILITMMFIIYKTFNFC